MHINQKSEGFMPAKKLMKGAEIETYHQIENLWRGEICELAIYRRREDEHMVSILGYHISPRGGINGIAAKHYGGIDAIEMDTQSSATGGVSSP